jgi:hypothetical protein
MYSANRRAEKPSAAHASSASSARPPGSDGAGDLDALARLPRPRAHVDAGIERPLRRGVTEQMPLQQVERPFRRRGERVRRDREHGREAREGRFVPRGDGSEHGGGPPRQRRHQLRLAARGDGDVEQQQRHADE